MIDLVGFASEREDIVPIIDNWGKSKGRQLTFSGIENGWYMVKIGSDYSIARKASPLEILKATDNLKTYRVYALGDEGIPVSFDEFHRKGFPEAVNINFLTADLFEVVKVILWEDKRFYFKDIDPFFQREVLSHLRQIFNQGKKEVVKGMTPELGYYFLLVSLMSQSYKEVVEIERMNLSPKEKEKRVKQFQNTFPERVKHVVESSGGFFVRMVKSNQNSYLVTWKIGRQVVKSTINDDMQILTAGFCLSGDDKRHTLFSIIPLAKMFRENAPLYITRE